MFKRGFSMMFGFGAGVGLSFVVYRGLRRQADRFRPDHVATRAALAVRDLTDEVRDAWFEGRVAMHQREAELRAQLARNN